VFEALADSSWHAQQQELLFMVDAAGAVQSMQTAELGYQG
jgi:hypothetical protein